MNILGVQQPLKEDYNIEQTNVYVNHYGDQRELIKWCVDNFGDYRLDYSREELDEPQSCTLFIFENMEQAMAFKLRWC